MNEEAVKAKLLLPFLNELGFDPFEISLEESFVIRLGRHRQTIKGKYDILCKRNGKNLFILELKNDAILISQDDIDQGISYARALDEIAPFTIITNGKITKIFDSITKLDITGKKIAEVSEFWKNGCTLSTDTDLRIRYEALKNFVSFSDNNLQEFCKHQVQDRMGPIIGNIDSPSAKFVKELFFQRNDLKSEFKDFVDSEASSFAIVGSAGVGKTNAMCSLALQSLEDKFVFFYNAAIISRSPLDHIAQDLNGFFSSKSESDLVLKKLDELGKSVNKKVLLFIDAIDESVNTNIALELSEIALAIRNFDNVKLCVSCKDNIWDSVLGTANNRTHLYEELVRYKIKLNSSNQSPGYRLNDFSEDELKEIIPLYKVAFGFKGHISDQLLKELKNGFFLRIFSEVYSNKFVPQIIDDKHLIDAYLKQSLAKTSINFHSGIRILSAIGQILINYKYTDRDEFDDNGIEIGQLLESLQLPLDKGLPEELFSRNILTRSNKQENYNISFYYSKIRDHIISFHTYKLQQLDDYQFAEKIEEFYNNYIGQSAIAFYINNASERHQEIFKDYKINKALNYVKIYNSYLEKNFGNFKELFKPGTKNEIGIVLPENILKNDGYALFRITSENPDKVIFEDLRHAFSGNYYESRLYSLGVETLHGSHISLLGKDQDKVAQKNIFEQLKDIIEKGRLSLYSNEAFLLEQVPLIIYYYSKDLGYDFKPNDFYLPRLASIYPLDLEDLQNRVQRLRANRFYWDKHLPADVLKNLVEEAIVNKMELPKLNIMGDFPPMEALSKIVQLLQDKGYSEITSHFLPTPDKSIAEARQLSGQNAGRNIGQMRTYQYSAEQAKLYIERFFTNLENCYKDFVDNFFPTFKDQFSFYKSMPYEYLFYMEDSDVLKSGSFGYRPSDNGHIKIQFKEMVHWEDYTKPFKEDKISVLRGFSLDQILHVDYYQRAPKTFDKINTPKVDEFCVLRNWVYQLLKDDIRPLIKKNGSVI